ncbi:MAG TPA: hypothetical protein VLG48_08830 [Candidatus Methylomirabilis sp.]|nr:hypothetical protein [Candidatus Methylomirabilis sp.]
MRKSAAVFVAVLLSLGVLGPVYAQQGPVPKASPETEGRKQETKGGEGAEVRKKAKKKKTASPPVPKASPETDVRKGEQKKQQ